MPLYEPKRLSDLLWNTTEAKKVLENVQKNQPTIIYGSPGVGKTTSVYCIANELDLTVYEINGSDERTKDRINSLLDASKHVGLLPFLIFIDEVDSFSAWSSLEKLLVFNRHPIVMAANEIWHIPDFIKNRCEQIKYHEPPTSIVIQLIRKVSGGKDVNYTKVSTTANDFRANLLSAIYGGSKHEKTDTFKDVENLIKRGIIPANRDKRISIWLLDNSTRFFHGRKLYEYIQFLAMTDRLHSNIVDKWEILALFNSSSGNGSVVYPYYLKRATVLNKVRVNGK